MLHSNNYREGRFFPDIFKHTSEKFKELYSECPYILILDSTSNILVCFVTYLYINLSYF